MGGVSSLLRPQPPASEDGTVPLEHLREFLHSNELHSQVLVWGDGDKYALGIGEHTESFRFPVVNQTLRGLAVRQLHVAAYHTYITTDDRRVFSYGWNNAGQCGVGSDEEFIKAPREVSRLRGLDLVLLASGALHTHFVTSSRQFYSVGSNAFGQLGNNSFDDERRPIEIVVPYLPSEPVRLLSCGDFFTIVIIGNELAYAWGRNNYCQVGRPRTNCVRKPEICVTLNRRCSAFVHMACGADHTALLSAEGFIYMFGSNKVKQFGEHLQKEYTGGLHKLPLGSDARASHLEANGNVTIAFSTAGALYMWGSRHTLFSGSRTGTLEHPRKIWQCDEANVRKIRLGKNHLHLLTRSGVLYSWVFTQWKAHPAPFLPNSYWSYFAQQGVDNSEKEETSADALLPEPPKTPSDPHSDDLQAFQEGDHSVEFETSHDDLEETLVEMLPDWFEPTTLDDAPGEDLHGVLAEPVHIERRFEDGQTVVTESESESESPEDGDNPPPRRAKLPVIPWVSYHIGTAHVKDFACGAFNTQFVLYNATFASEYAPLAESPAQYFSDKHLVLSDGSRQKIHTFFIAGRCPRLLSKKFRVKLLPTITPSVLHTLLKNIYYSFTDLEDLSDDELVELRMLAKALKYKNKLLMSCLRAQISLRSHFIDHFEQSREVVEESNQQYKRQLQFVYESRRKTDFLVYAGTAPRSNADDLEQGPTEGLLQSIPVHKAILACRCPFFEALFRSNFSESLAGTNALNCDISTLDQLLRYLYYDFTDFTVDAAAWILDNSFLLFVDKNREELRLACSNTLRRHGRKVELKRINSKLDIPIDPYEEGRPLPEFVRRSDETVTTSADTSERTSIQGTSTSMLGGSKTSMDVSTWGTEANSVIELGGLTPAASSTLGSLGSGSSASIMHASDRPQDIESLQATPSVPAPKIKKKR